MSQGKETNTVLAMTHKRTGTKDDTTGCKICKVQRKDAAPSLAVQQFATHTRAAVDGRHVRDSGRLLPRLVVVILLFVEGIFLFLFLFFFRLWPPPLL